jgi:hypothetical protein
MARSARCGGCTLHSWIGDAHSARLSVGLVALLAQTSPMKRRLRHEEVHRDARSARAAFFATRVRFVVLRDALTVVEVEQLRVEADHAIRDATGRWYRHCSPGGGIEGQYVPATSEQTPRSLEFAQRFAGTVEQLLGAPTLFGFAHHSLLFGQAGWHTDSGHDVASVKVAAYLDPLDAASGALRVLRCSHHVPYEQLREVLRRLALQDDAAGRKATQAVPGLLLPLLRRLLPSHCPIALGQHARTPRRLRRRGGRGSRRTPPTTALTGAPRTRGTQ